MTLPINTRAAWRARSVAATLLTVAAVIAWALVLRPQFLDGPAGYVLVAGESMEPRMHTGDLVIIRARDHYEVGDVVSYRIADDEPGAGGLVIHRIIGGTAASGYRVKGDNRERPDLWRPKPAEIQGRMWVHVPGVGRVFAFLRQPLIIATLAALLTFLSFGRKRPGAEAPHAQRTGGAPASSAGSGSASVS
jgi:signal peptidase